MKTNDPFKKRYYVKTNKGYVNATWRNGRTFPEAFWYTNNPQSFTLNRAYTLEQIGINNGLEAEMIEIL
jgi:hypothetical protein